MHHANYMPLHCPLKYSRIIGSLTKIHQYYKVIYFITQNNERRVKY